MKLTVNEKYLFCREMAMILKSGFSLHQGIMMIGEEIDNSNIKNVLENLVASIDEGCSFSDALKANEAFDEYMINLVNIGETSGNMDTVMASLSDYYFRIDDITDKLKQALTNLALIYKINFEEVINDRTNDINSLFSLFKDNKEVFNLLYSYLSCDNSKPYFDVLKDSLEDEEKIIFESDKIYRKTNNLV